MYSINGGVNWCVVGSLIICESVSCVTVVKVLLHCKSSGFSGERFCIAVIRGRRLI